VLSLLFGVLLILPIGGADMPTVISLLNSYAGLSAVAMGFVLENKVLITAGALDGSSGFILSVIMCKAMNRSFSNVLFGAFGQVAAVQAAAEAKAVKSATPRDVADILENASSVVVIPGLRHGRRPGATPRARAVRPARRSAGSNAASRFTRWRAACPGT
jgi:NAD(P) transhydrogenase subunit beta